MSDYFRYPMPAVQALGLVAVPTGDQRDTGVMLPKPVAAAVLTLTQRDDGHVTIFDRMMTAEDETQFPLPWLIEQALIAGASTLLGVGDAQVLLADAARQRFFVEPKLASLTTGEHAVDVARLAGEGIDEAVLCRHLGIPRLDIDPAGATQLWTEHPRTKRDAYLSQYALASAVSRVMLWANLMATRTAEPGWFYETMLALHGWLAEREVQAPDLYAWSTSKPIMHAVSLVQEYRRDIGRRHAGLDSDWPAFEPGLFHS